MTRNVSRRGMPITICSSMVYLAENIITFYRLQVHLLRSACVKKEYSECMFQTHAIGLCNIQMHMAYKLKY